MNEELMIYESDEDDDFEQIEENPLVKIAKKVNEHFGGYEPSVVSVGQIAVMENN